MHAGFADTFDNVIRHNRSLGSAAFTVSLTDDYEAGDGEGVGQCGIDLNQSISRPVCRAGVASTPVVGQAEGTAAS